MKLLLIGPVTTARTLAATERKKLRQGIGYPSMGLTTVAALTPPDIEVQVIDESVEDIDFDITPDLVGITVEAPTAPYAYELASYYRKKNVPVVLGGIHTSLNPEEATLHADTIVIGEAELTWRDLINDFRKGRIKKKYQAESLADLDATPVPRRDLLDDKNYQIPYVVQASKGCPYGCEFCSLHAYLGHRVRYRKVEKVISEIKRMPGSRFIFADDNIYCDRRYTKQLFKALASGQKMWAAESSWHIAFDEEILSLAKRGGCVGLFIGLDSINEQRMMRKVPKSNNIERTYIEAIKRIRDKGIGVVAAFVFGLDNDDQSVFERSLNVILKGGANLVNFSVLVPYPGTPIYSRLKREHRIIESDWAKYISPNVCFQPRHLSIENLTEGTLWAQKEFYSLSNIITSSIKASMKLGWAAGLLSLKLNLAQKKNWGKGSTVES